MKFFNKDEFLFLKDFIMFLKFYTCFFQDSYTLHITYLKIH
jgi:hypothetical protein